MSASTFIQLKVKKDSRNNAPVPEIKKGTCNGIAFSSTFVFAAAFSLAAGFIFALKTEYGLIEDNI
jgi:hypothetical protein